MPHLKSLFPDLPSLPDFLNIWDTVIGQPHHDEFPDYDVHKDEETGQVLGYKALKKRVNDLAASLGGPVSLGGLNLKREDREMIGIMSDNSSDYIMLVLALLKIAVPFALISLTRLFIAPHYLSKALPVAKEIGIPTDLLYTMNSPVDGHDSLEGFIQRTTTAKIPHTEARQVPRDTLAWLFFSSGTTGLPKAVMISHGNLLFAFKQAVAMQQYRQAAGKPPTPLTPDGLPAVLAFLPMHHTFGLHIYAIRAFITPTRFIILRKWDVATVLKLIPKYKVSLLSMVPSMYYQVVNHPDFRKTDMSSILVSHSGAAHLPREISSKFVEQTPNNTFFSEGYGMSETTVSAIVKPFPGSFDGKLKTVPGSLGVLLPGMEARIVREDGTEADFNEVGELWLKGDNVVAGYFDDAQATQESFVGGWLRTGDHFKVDEEQYFYFADRVKDTLKVSGSQVSPVEIEEVLLAHPQKLVADVTVAGVLGSGRTSDERVPRAWVVLSETGERVGAETATKELEKWHQTNLSKYKWLRGGIEIVKEIPKSPTGKTLRRVLQDEYEHRAEVKAKL